VELREGVQVSLIDAALRAEADSRQQTDDTYKFHNWCDSWHDPPPARRIKWSKATADEDALE